METDRIVGAFLFPDVWQPWPLDVAERELDVLASFGVNTIFTESEFYRHDLISLAHRLGMRWIGGIACFSDHAHQHQIFEAYPELWPVLETGERRPPMEWYVGITPTFEAYNQSRIALAERLVSEYELDGLALDFIRWPLHWELEMRPDAPPPLQSSFDPHTLACFQQESGVALPAVLEDAAANATWILTYHRAEWVDFKCAVITRFVQETLERLHARRKANLVAGLYTLPLLQPAIEVLAGQRLLALGQLVDWVSPMVYHAMVHRSVAWASKVISEAASVLPGKILPVLQVDSAEGAEAGADWGPPFPAAEWQDVVQQVLDVPGTRGVIAFTGTSLVRDDRGERLRVSLNVARTGAD